MTRLRTLCLALLGLVSLCAPAPAQAQSTNDYHLLRWDGTEFQDVYKQSTGSGGLVFGTSPTLVAPTLGNATATTINGLAISTSTGTLTLANGKTLTASNTLTMAGTDGSTLNIGGGGTLGSAAYTASTAYAPATSGSSLLSGNGSGGFSNVTIGSGLSFSGGILSSTASTSTFLTTANAGTATEVLTYRNTTASTGKTTMELRAGPGQSSVPFPDMLRAYDANGTHTMSIGYDGRICLARGMRINLDDAVSGLAGSIGLQSNSLGSFDIFGCLRGTGGLDDNLFINAILNIINGGGGASTGFGVASSSSIAQAGVSLFPGFGPTSGSAEWRSFNIQTVINQTGGSNGITSGYCDDTILTSFADYRSIYSKITNALAYAIYTSGDAKVRLGVLDGSPLRTVWADADGVLSKPAVGNYQGSGSPEGSVTAPVGSTFQRTDGGAGTTFYVKESGTGNTGWVGK